MLDSLGGLLLLATVLFIRGHGALNENIGYWARTRLEDLGLTYLSRTEFALLLPGLLPNLGRGLLGRLGGRSLLVSHTSQIGGRRPGAYLLLGELLRLSCHQVWRKEPVDF